MLTRKKVGARAFIVICLFIFFSCKDKVEKKIEHKETKNKVTLSEEYVCPSQCDNGMNYYMEGKCDICHHNLIKKE